MASFAINEKKMIKIIILIFIVMIIIIMIIIITIIIITIIIVMKKTVKKMPIIIINYLRPYFSLPSVLSATTH